MMSGSDVTAAANVNKIIKEFKIASAAMNMYYADNKTKCDGDTLTSAQLLMGLETYMKSTSPLVLLQGNMRLYL